VELRNEWNRVKLVLILLSCLKAIKGVLLLIDGEKVGVQDAADELVTNMMRKYNKDKLIYFAKCNVNCD
jgi:proline dehydrogenase